MGKEEQITIGLFLLWKEIQRKSGNVSIARTKDMNREDMNLFFEVLKKAMIHLFNKADAIHNMKETFSSTMKQKK